MNIKLINTMLACMIIGIVLSIPFIQGIIPVPIETCEIVILIGIIACIIAPRLHNNPYSEKLCFKLVITLTGCIGAINIWQADYENLALNFGIVAVATFLYIRKPPQ